MLKNKDKHKTNKHFGRPFKFKSVNEIESISKEYFKKCDNEGIPYTITGLALALGTYRDVLLDYANRAHNQPEDLSDAIKTAKEKVVNYAETKLFSTTPTGAIFALKNHGWSDKQELEHSGGIVNANVDMSKVSDEMLEKLANKFAKENSALYDSSGSNAIARK